jgi:PAS domain S-box-containing protein
MAEGLIFVDTEDRISLCNESAGQIWGTDVSELLGKFVYECPSAELRSTFEKIIKQAKQKPGFTADHVLDLRQGRYLASYSTVHGEDGRYLGLVFLSLDISERVALEQEQKRLRDHLFQQEKMVLVGQIAASVAHELNTPLATILLRAQLIEQQADKESDLSDMRVLEGEAKRCRRIIDSLLKFSRRSEGITSRTDLNGLIQESLSIVENDLTLKGIKIETDYSHNGTTVCVDSNQIQQVLLNLVTNAADAMPDGGRLHISTRLLSDQAKVEIQVTDNGCGMEESVFNRIFDPFFTTKEQGKGTGLGLAICQRIVEEHEGEIKIQSQPGHGTTVWVSLPHTPMEVAADE